MLTPSPRIASSGRSALWVVAGLLVLTLVLQALPPAAHDALRYHRASVLEGELWRLFSGHLIHLGWTHWMLNAMGLTLCIALSDRPIEPGWMLRRLVALGLGVSLMLLVLDPRVRHYVGLSGVLYGLLVLVLWPQVRRGVWVAIAALGLVLGWMAWQVVSGPLASKEAMIGGYIVAWAHVYGVASAAALILIQRLWPWSRSAEGL